MPSERINNGHVTSHDNNTPVVTMKRKRSIGSPLLNTPTLVLEQVQNGDMPDDERKLQALCNAVIAAAVTEDEDEDSVSLLTALLCEEGVDPNAGNEETWDKYGGGPLYQACNLDLPETTRALLEHGASVVQEYKGVTPLELALSQKNSRCVKVIMDHIQKLEKQARAGRKRGDQSNSCKRMRES